MALYRTGTASLSADGVITGQGTKWRDPLTLIRTGATIIFLDDGIKLAVISDIISDTEMRAITTDGATATESKYVILLNDSLTVDGMAQDVAETLRYYQSKETVIEEALDFFRDFDLEGLKKMVEQVLKSEANAKQSETNAKNSEMLAEDFKNETEQIKNETQSIKDGAVGEITTAKDNALQEVGTTKESALSEISTAKETSLQEMEVVKQETFDARDEAESAEMGANQAKADSETAKTDAEKARDKAKEYADSIDPLSFLKKENNLQDLADRAAAWLNVRPIGSTPLSADPVNDYDATTKRWVENLVGAGITGPTMNGIMNYGVGVAVSWISRAYIPPYLQPLDGQLLEREKFPDLWMHAQQHGVISDADWLADQTKRGSYSDGDGQTTFRVPDWNGIQGGSIPGVFFKGGSGTYDKVMALNAAPNIKGTVTPMYPNVSHIPLEDLGGAITNIAIETNGYSYPRNVAPGVAFRRGIQFDASLYHPSYGRNGATEVVPNRVSGVWCVRANGSFVAANTSWNVINGDEKAPDAGTVVSGGEVISRYDIDGKVHIRAHYSVKGKYLQDAWAETKLINDQGNNVATSELHPGSTFALRYDTPLENGVTIGGVFRSVSTGKTVVNMYGQTEANGYSTMYFTLGKDGNVNYPSRVMQLNEANDVIIFKNPLVTDAVRAGAFSSRANDRYANFLAYDTPGVDGGCVIETGSSFSAHGFYFFTTAVDGNKVGKILSSTRGLVMFEGSDRSWKENIVDAKEGSLYRIEKIRIREYDWKDGGYHERGWIAQELQEVDPQYVSGTGIGDDKLSVSTKALIADLIGAVQTLSKEEKEKDEVINSMKLEIESLKTGFDEMKAAIAALASK